MITLSAPVPDRIKSASEFINEVKTLDRARREELAVQWLLEGHVPSHMRCFVDIEQTFCSADGTGMSLTISVLPDVLSVGTDDDYVRIPMSPLMAQRVCDAWECMLPTSKISDIVWHAAVNKLLPLPWGPPYDASMMSLDRVIVHNGRIESQLKSVGADRTALTAGHKKDVVLTPKLQERPRQVAIYGWHQKNGSPIQPLYLGHENTYADYSHGIRLVSVRCSLDGSEVLLSEVLNDPNTCASVSSEGPSSTVRQPGT